MKIVQVMQLHIVATKSHVHMVRILNLTQLHT